MKMQNKYVDSYLRMFFEGIIGETKHINKNIGIVPLNDFFKNIILIQNTKIITQTPNNEDYGDTLLQFIFNSQFGNQLTKSDLITKLNKNWTFFQKAEKSDKFQNTPILFFKFDFSNSECIQMFKCLDLNYVKQIGQEVILKQFHENIKDTTQGFVRQCSNVVIFCLNSKNSSLETVRHQLTHYFQIVLKGIKK